MVDNKQDQTVNSSASLASGGYGKVFHLWSSDDYVEIDGSREPDVLIASFTSLKALNTWKETNWFELKGDFRGVVFDKEHRRFTWKGKQSTYVAYYTVERLWS